MEQFFNLLQPRLVGYSIDQNKGIIEFRGEEVSLTTEIIGENAVKVVASCLGGEIITLTYPFEESELDSLAETIGDHFFNTLVGSDDEPRFEKIIKPNRYPKKHST